MERKNIKSLQIPNELKSDLEEKINNLYSGSITDGFILYLNKNIEILRRENIIFQEVNIIKKIGLKNENQIEYGYFTENVIKHVFQRKNAGRGKVKLIKALIIAVYAEKWEDVFNYYFDENGLKKPVINEVKKNSKIKINSTEKLQINKKQRVKGIEILFREKIWKKNSIFLLILLILFSIFFNPIKNRISNKFNKLKVKQEQVKIYNCEPFIKTKDNYNILILPFEPIEQCKYKITNIEKTIMARLYDLSLKDILNLQIKFDTLDCVHNSEEAEEIGKDLNADLVIWGDLYEHCSDSNEASLKFINLSYKNFNSDIYHGESGITKFASLSEIRRGKLQKDIDYIIYFIATTRAYYQKNYFSALKYFDKFVKMGHQSISLLMCATLCYYNSGDFKNTLEYSKILINLCPERSELHIFYAYMLAYHFNEYSTAKTQYELAIKLNPSSSDAYRHYAILLEDKFKNNKEAERYYKYAIEKDSKSFENHIKYAIFLNNKINDYENAKTQYEKALEIEPYSCLAHYKYGMLMEQNFGNSDIAELHYKKALEINPNSAETHFAYFTMFIYKYNDLLSAKMHIEKAITIDSNFVSALLVYANFIYENYNDTNNAKKYYEKALKIEPNNSVLNFQFSKFLLKTSIDIKRAKILYNKALKINPQLKEIG